MCDSCELCCFVNCRAVFHSTGVQNLNVTVSFQHVFCTLYMLHLIIVVIVIPYDIIECHNIVKLTMRLL